MATPDQYSESNILNSLSLIVAGKFLAAGYLIYWYQRDAVQIDTTATGWYYQYSVNRAAYLTDSTFQSAYSNAKGLVSLVDAIPAVPRFISRLTSDTSIGDPDLVLVPAMSLELGAAQPLGNIELGSVVKYRTRHLVADCYVRTKEETAQFKDFLAEWFDEDTVIMINDHDSGNPATAVGPVEVLDVTVASSIVVDRVDAITYEVLLNSRLEYVA